ncbi:ATP-binding protein [Lactococcus piscium]|uniref:Primosomal DnaI family protein n=1 Tax=Pseudolactococcus piscium MKFS47 TaxID=297352 RepID=A0A0D6DYZ1_9LACT|nr:ATP-binding protein [Lactococcus piscium]CEN29162.1 Primosomal DnaI family protein [Lactococcus piscium MKFS47]
MESIGEVMEKIIDHDKYDAVVDSIMSNEEIQAFISGNEMQETEIRKSYPKFYEYLHPNKAFDGFTSKLIFHNGYADVIYRETEEAISRKKAHSAINRLKAKSLLLDETIKTATFGNFNIETDEEQQAFEFAKNLAEFYKNGGQGNSFMSGPAGSGKSHLSMAILKSYLENGEKTALFVSYSHVVRLIKDSFNNRDSIYTQNNIMSLLTNVDLLVMDDIGSENNSDFSEELLTDVLDGRISTIITTNLSSEELRGNANKKGRYNQRTASRMFRGIGGKAFNFKGIKDKRVLPF